MQHLTRQCIATVTVLSCVLICASAKSQSKLAQANSAVSGRVTIGGKPAPGIVISVYPFSSSYGPRQVWRSYRATTDEEGGYRIKDLPPDNYQIVPLAPAYVLMDSDADGSKNIILSEGESVQNIDFALVRGGVVTGKVLDSEGRPLVEQPVSLIPVESEQPFARVQPGGQTQTDDRGIYRLFGIRRGRYVVSAGRDDRTYFDNVAIGGRSFRQTFHPNVSEMAKATIIEVGEGTETTNIDISVGRPEETFSVSGRVIDESGQPLRNVLFSIRTIVDESNLNRGTVFSGSTPPSNAKGEFQVDNLVPGKYAIFIAPSSSGMEMFSDSVRFEITDHDVSGIVLKGQTGAAISGVVSLEGSDNKGLHSKLQRLPLVAFVLSEQSFSGFGRHATLNPDLSFRIGGLQAGTVHFQLSSIQGPVNEFTIIRVERDGVVQSPGLIISGKEELTGIRIIVAYSTGRVRGVVRFENGELPQSARVFVRISKPGEKLNVPTQVDERRHFLIENLATGTYDLNVSVYWQGLKSRPPSHQQQVEVRDGETTNLNVVLDLKPQERVPPQ